MRKDGFTIAWKCPKPRLTTWDSTRLNNELTPVVKFWGSMSHHRNITEEFAGPHFWMKDVPEEGEWGAEQVFLHNLIIYGEGGF